MDYGTRVENPPDHLLRCPFTEEQVAEIKAAFLHRTGGAAGQPCASSTCLAIATTRVYWPVLDGDEYPLYCDACAAWGRKILAALGVRYHADDLPRPADAARAIVVGGSIPIGETP